MADVVDIDPFGKHDKTDVQPDEPRAKPFLSTPGGVTEGGSTWELEQETSFGGGKTQSTRLKKCVLKGCIESYLKKQANTRSLPFH